MIEAGDRVRRTGPDYKGVVRGCFYIVADTCGEAIELKGFESTVFRRTYFKKVGGDLIYSIEQKHPFGGWVEVDEFDSKKEAIKELNELDSTNIRIVKVVAEYKTELKVY